MYSQITQGTNKKVKGDQNQEKWTTEIPSKNEFCPQNMYMYNQNTDIGEKLGNKEQENKETSILQLKMNKEE